MNVDKSADNVEMQYQRARGKRNMYLLLSVAAVILVAVGYFADSGFTMPDTETAAYFLLNFGTYGVAGFAVLFAMILLIGGIVILFHMVRETGSLLLGIGAFILFYGLAVGLFMALLSVVPSLIKTDFKFVFLGMNIDGTQPIPGPGNTVGEALVCSLMYDIPMVVFVFKAIKWGRVSHKLKTPAATAAAEREAREQREAEEKGRQKQSRKEQKERERREREAWERHKRMQEEDAYSGEAFFFFANCTTMEQLEARFKGLMRAYHPDTGSGDLEICQIISEQYQKLKEQFQQSAQE